MTILTLVAAERTFTRLERVRVKVLESTLPHNPAGQVEVAPDLTPFVSLAQPLALISRISNTSGESVPLALEVDGNVACATIARARSVYRLDCIAYFSKSGDHSITIKGPPDRAWNIDYLEVASHFGNTTDIIDSVILPSGSSAYGQLTTSAIIVTWLGTLVLIALSRKATGSRARIASNTLSVLSALILTSALASPWVTQYEVVLSVPTYWLLVTLPAFPFVTIKLWQLAKPARQGRIGVAAAYRPAIVAVVVLAGFTAFMQAKRRTEFAGSYSGLLRISRVMFDGSTLLKQRQDVRSTLTLREDGGYDGQFAYFVTFDPLMQALAERPMEYRTVVDAVPYRFGRIGFSWLTQIVSLGQWRLFPTAMVWLVIVGTAACAFALSLMAECQGKSPALGALVLLVPGFWESVQNVLPEPIAAALVVSGIFAYTYDRFLASALCLAASLLVRETGVVFVLCLTAWLAPRRGWRTALVFIACALLPVALWRVHVAAVIFPDWGIRGLLDQPADLSMPLSGFGQLWKVASSGAYLGGSAEMRRAAFALPPVLIGGWILTVVWLFKSRTPVALAGAIYGLIAVSLNYDMIWVHVGNGQRGTYEVFLSLMLLLTDSSVRSSRALTLATGVLWSVAAVYVVFLSFDAHLIRSALHLPF
ncbi:MAG: hypothetical protein U0Q11_04575 [Vicinamibacterales bacterium]